MIGAPKRILEDGGEASIIVRCGLRVTRAASRINKTLNAAVVKKRMRKPNITPIGASPADLAVFINEEDDREANRDAKFKIDRRHRRKIGTNELNSGE